VSDPDEADPDLSGVLERTNPLPEWLNLVVSRTDIEVGADEDSLSRYAWVRAGPQTDVIFQSVDSRWRAGSSADIPLGAVLRVWTTGVEMRSLPPQYIARRIEVLNTGM
jgi:hypothetical protein